MDVTIGKCILCGKVFKKKKLLIRHLKEVHKSDSEGKPLPGSEEKFQCLLCDKSFTRKFPLQQHITNIHFPKSCEVFNCTACKYSSQYKSNVKRHILKCHASGRCKGTTGENYKCSKCRGNFSYKSSLRRHEKKHHNFKRENNLMNARKCPLCSFHTYDPYLKSIYVHFENAHNISLNWENYSFNSLSEFFDWKRDIEKQTISSYIINSKSKNTTTFQCRRCGILRSDGKNQRHKRIRSTCKINGFCPGSIKLKVKNDCITAMYQSVHVGHANELKYVRLSKEEKECKETFETTQLLEIDSQVEELVFEEASIEDNSQDFEKKKEMLFCEINKLEQFVKDNCTTGEQIDFMMKTIKQSMITIEPMKLSNPLPESVPLNQPGNTNVVKQLLLITPLQNHMKTKVLFEEDIRKLSLDLLMGKHESLLDRADQTEPGPTSINSDHTYCNPNMAAEVIMEL